MRNLNNSWQNYKSLAEKSSAKWGETLQSLESLINKVTAADYPKGEFWKYVSFASIREESLSWPEPSKQENRLSLDGNRLSIEINDLAKPLSETLDSAINGSFKFEPLTMDNLFSRKQQPWSEQDNPFWSLGDGFLGRGLSIKFLQSDAQANIKYNFHDQSGIPSFSQNQIHIVVEKSVEAKLFIEVDAESYKGLANLCMACELAEGATLEVFALEKSGEGSHLLYNCSAQVAGGATFNHFDLTTTGQWSRHNIHVDLNEKEAATHVLGAYLIDGHDFVDHHTKINHKVKETYSTEDYRGILAGQSRAVFNGLVYIAENASGSRSEQINKNLMLSERAEVDTKPELQIYNDDVKATHGATVGQLDDEQRFYLQSRGYNSKQASQILAKAFVFDLLEQQEQSVHDFYSGTLQESLGRFGDLI